MKFILEHKQSEFPRLVIQAESNSDSGKVIKEWAALNGLVPREDHCPRCAKDSR